MKKLVKIAILAMIISASYKLGYTKNERDRRRKQEEISKEIQRQLNLLNA